MSTALDPDTFGRESPCFGCSPTHPTGFHLHFAREDDAVTTRFVPGPEHQGPPGVMHGGLVLTLADELAAWTVIGLRDRFGFTASVEARLRLPVRVGVEVVGRGTILRDSSRVLKIATTLTQSGEVAFEGTFNFVLLDQSGAERLLDAPLPEAWKRFCR
jgi:acyl-coenzyme A thioesterase PaaI-like protein